MKKALIIGIGNNFRGDDAVGLELANALENPMKEFADVVCCHGDAMKAMELWKDRETVFIIDAVSSGSKPGVLHSFAAHEKKIPAIFSRSSTHLFGIGEVIELAKSLGTLPARVYLYGIEGKEYAMKQEISQTLKQKMPALCEEIVANIQQHLGVSHA